LLATSLVLGSATAAGCRPTGGGRGKAVTPVAVDAAAPSGGADAGASADVPVVTDARDDEGDLPGIDGPPPRPAWRWGPARKDDCRGQGLRQISAPLRNVPAGTPAAEACRQAPRNVMGIDFAAPDRCQADGATMRGQWDVPDTTCLATAPPPPVRGADGDLKLNTPLEGFADLHVHQMGHLGFSGSVVWGGAFGPAADVLGGIPAAMKRGHDRSEALFDGDIAGGLVGLASHGEDGHPAFASWPSRELAVHQQMYEDWLHRAYQGGLRLMVMLAVNSEDMFGRGENDLTLIGTVPMQDARAPGRTGNDMESLEWQVREAYRMQDHVDAKHGGPGRGWYRIVRDPDEAEAAIAGGKLAVILGTELQHLFNCDADRPPCSEATVVAGLDRLEAMGVNHVFPVHHKLNQFGGPSQFNPLTNGPTEACHETEEACSAVGLLPIGKFLIEELTARGMLIDTEHLSWKAFDDAMAIVESRRYPVIASHVGPFDLKADAYQNEQVRRTDQLRRILGVGGMLGIIHGVGVEEYAPSRAAGVRLPISCGGADRWANAYLYMKDLAGGGLTGAGGRITVGSDWNGFASWPGPRHGRQPCAARAARDGSPIPKPARVGYPLPPPAGLVPAAVGGSPPLTASTAPRPLDYNDEGLMHVGLTPEWLEDMRLAGVTLADLEPLYRSARGVVELWRAARARVVPGDRHHLRWAPASPFDVLAFEHRDASRDVEGLPGLPLCRTRVGRRLGLERAGACHPVEGDAAAPAVPAAPLPAVAISAYHAGRCLDVDGASTSDGARVQQYACNGGGNQRWQLRPTAGGTWQLAAEGSGKCLAVSGDGPGAGATQATCGDTASQRFSAVRSGNTFALRTAAGLCLEVSGQSRANGAGVVTAACSGASHQQWDIEALRAADHDRLYQADKNRIAWLPAASGRHTVAVVVDGDRTICRTLDPPQAIGVVSGNDCAGRTADGTPIRAPRFERLFQER
jgi:microsomal dipeptidase-like Zn-dependent dipeptidase